MKRIYFLIVTMSIIGLANVAHAQATFIWTNGSDVWQDSSAWTTNGGATGAVPGALDNADFTNAGTYYVTLTNSVSVNQVLFNNATLTTATITLDLGTNSFSATQSGGLPPAFEVADVAESTTTVYIATTLLSGAGLNVDSASARILVGRNGIGTLFITNGAVNANSLAMGNGINGRGTVVLSGPATEMFGFAVQIGNNSGSTGNSLVISNSARMEFNTLEVGFTGENGNSLIVDSGSLQTIGTVGSITSVGVGAGENNTVTVRNGGIWTDYNKMFSIGGTGHGNSVIIGSNSQVQVQSAVIAARNTLNLQGGTLGRAPSISPVIVTNFGTIMGFGSIQAGTVFNEGVLSPGVSNFVGTISLNLNLNPALELGPGSTTLLKLDVSQPGSNDLINLTFIGNLSYGGTLTVSNVGPALVAGDVFQLFANGSEIGDFSTTNLPPLAGGLSWDTSQLDTAGIINVVPVLTGNDVQISSIALSGNSITIQIPSVTDVTYQLQVTPSLTPTNWTDVGASQGGTGGVLTFSDSGGATNGPTRFYRIDLTVP